MCNVCVIMDGFLATHALGHLIYCSSTVHYVPKCMSCHKAIVMKNGRAHCFHDNLYIMLIFLLQDLRTLCVVDHF